jgi:hypothetical protein
MCLNPVRPWGHTPMSFWVSEKNTTSTKHLNLLPSKKSLRTMQSTTGLPESSTAGRHCYYNGCYTPRYSTPAESKLHCALGFYFEDDYCINWSHHWTVSGDLVLRSWLSAWTTQTAIYFALWFVADQVLGLKAVQLSTSSNELGTMWQHAGWWRLWGQITTGISSLPQDNRSLLYYWKALLLQQRLPLWQPDDHWLLWRTSSSSIWQFCLLRSWLRSWKVFHLFEAPTSEQHRLLVGLTSGIFADCEFGGIAPCRPQLAKMDSEAVCSKVTIGRLTRNK